MMKTTYRNERIDRWFPLSVSASAVYTLELYARSVLETAIMGIIVKLRIDRQKCIDDRSSATGIIKLQEKHVTKGLELFEKFWLQEGKQY